MAKRVRGQRTSHRSGGQPTPQRRAADASLGRTAAGGPAADIDAAIEDVLIAETALSIDEPVAAAQSGRPRRGAKVRADSLQARIAAENVYVREDLRRILVVSGVLFGGLAVAWFVLVFLNVLNLY